MGDSPDVATGKRLLDLAKHQGFQFQRVAPGLDAPLRGVGESDDWRDTIYLGVFWMPGSCSAIRSRKSSHLGRMWVARLGTPPEDGCFLRCCSGIRAWYLPPGKWAQRG